MIHGLNQKELNLLKSLVVEPLIQKGAKVWIFGSRARGTQHQFSDVDLLYIDENDSKISKVDLSLIKEAIEESDFPYKVDIVNISEIAESYKIGVKSDMRLLTI